MLSQGSRIAQSFKEGYDHLINAPIYVSILPILNCSFKKTEGKQAQILKSLIKNLQFGELEWRHNKSLSNFVDLIPSNFCIDLYSLHAWYMHMLLRTEVLKKTLLY